MQRASKIMPHSKYGLWMMLIPNKGSVESINGSTAQ